MVLAEAIIGIFVFLIGVAIFYKALREDRVFIWPLLATIIFLVNTLYSYSIPFNFDASGAVIGTPANALMGGINLLFMFLSLLKAASVAFEYLRLRTF